MAENESSSEKSYDSDDSEINYVREYVRSEVEEGTFISDHEEHVPSLTEFDPDTYKPYEYEPIASEEWLSEEQTPNLNSNESFWTAMKGRNS